MDFLFFSSSCGGNNCKMNAQEILDTTELTREDQVDLNLEKSIKEKCKRINNVSIVVKRGGGVAILTPSLEIINFGDKK